MAQNNQIPASKHTYLGLFKKTHIAKLAFAFLILAILSWQNQGFADDLDEATKTSVPDLPKGLQKVTTIEGISEYTLNNGLKILLAPDQSKSQTTVNMSYKVGSRHEGPGETGMAHLLEHLLFRGSPDFPDALAEFSRRGMAANGSTSADLTNYYASFNSDAATLSWYLRWQAEAMQHASISKADLDAEMTVVRNEMERGENSPFNILLQQVSAAAYVWHPYGRSVIGARSDIENVDIQQLQDFYHQYYQPDNAVLIITGKFDVAETLKDIAIIFGNIAKPDRQIPKSYTIEPVQEGPRSIVLERIGGSPIGLIQYHIPSALHDTYTNLALGTAMLSDSPSGPLYTELVESNLATSVFGFARAMNQPGYTLFGIQIQEHQDADDVLAKLQNLISIKTIDGLDDKSLNRIKTAWLNDWQQIYNSQSSLASALSSAVSHGDWRLFFIERDRTKIADLEAIKLDLKTWLVPNNRTSGLYIPTDKPIYAPANTPANLEPWLKELKTDTTRAAIASFDTNPLAIDQASQISTLKLNNGDIKLALLPKQTAGEEIYANMSIGFGSLDEFNSLGIIPQITANMLMRGSTNMSRQEIEDRLNELDSDLYFSGRDNVLLISMRSSAKNFNELLDLSFNILKNPNFPESELKKIKSSLLTNINNQASNPSWLVSNKLERNQQPWATTDIRYVTDAKQSKDLVNQLQQSDIIDFYNKFYGAGTIEFAAVGQLDVDSVKAKLTANITDWQLAPKYERIPQTWYLIKPKDFQIPTPGKANANYMASLSLQLQDNNPDWIPLFLANYLIGGSEDSRLWQTIRSKQGLSYSVGSSISSSPWEPYAKWSIFASMAPENAVKLKDTITQVLRDTKQTGFKQQEIDQGVISLLNFLQLGRSSDANLSTKWLRYLKLNRNFGWDQKIIDRLQNIKAKELNEVLNKYLDIDKFSIAIAYDQAKKLSD